MISRHYPLFLVVFAALPAISAESEVLNQDISNSIQVDSETAHFENEIIRQDVREFQLQESTRRDLIDLAELAPHSGPRILHGRATENPKSQSYLIVPDTESVQVELSTFNLDSEAILLFATAIAAQDRVLQSEHDASYGIHVFDQNDMQRQPSQQEIETWRAKYRNSISRDANIGADALRRFINSVGLEKFKKIKGHIIGRSLSRKRANFQETLTNLNQAKSACSTALKNCSFPGGFVDNCAGFLGLSVEQIKGKCSATNSNAK